MVMLDRVVPVTLQLTVIVAAFALPIASKPNRQHKADLGRKNRVFIELSPVAALLAIKGVFSIQMPNNLALVGYLSTQASFFIPPTSNLSLVRRTQPYTNLFFMKLAGILVDPVAIS